MSFSVAIFCDTSCHWLWKRAILSLCLSYYSETSHANFYGPVVAILTGFHCISKYSPVSNLFCWARWPASFGFWPETPLLSGMCQHSTVSIFSYYMAGNVLRHDTENPVQWWTTHTVRSYLAHSGLVFTCEPLFTVSWPSLFGQNDGILVSFLFFSNFYGQAEGSP